MRLVVPTVDEEVGEPSTRLGREYQRSSAGGSLAKTSRPAPKMRPASRASSRAASSTSSPLAVFTSMAVLFMAERRAALTRPLVSSLRRVWSVTTSALAKSSSRPAALTPFSSQKASSMRGSWARISMPKPLARRATHLPTAPRPTMPRVLPKMSMPVSLPQSLLLQRPSMSTTLRATASMRAKAKSATALLLAPTVRSTTMPLRRHSSMSTLSRPTP